MIPMKLLYALLNIYLFIDRRERFAVTGFIFYGDKVLLVRHRYGNPNWTPPGGFIKKNEKPADGLQREIYEEVGIELSKVVLMSTLRDSRPHKNITVHRFYARANSPECIIDEIEIKEAGWFAPEEVGELDASADEHLMQAIKYHKQYATV